MLVKVTGTLSGILMSLLGGAWIFYACSRPKAVSRTNHRRLSLNDIMGSGICMLIASYACMAHLWRVSNDILILDLHVYVYILTVTAWAAIIQVHPWQRILRVYAPCCSSASRARTFALLLSMIWWTAVGIQCSTGWLRRSSASVVEEIDNEELFRLAVLTTVPLSLTYLAIMRLAGLAWIQSAYPPSLSTPRCTGQPVHTSTDSVRYILVMEGMYAWSMVLFYTVVMINMLVILLVWTEGVRGADMSVCIMMVHLMQSIVYSGLFVVVPAMYNFGP
jgi:hypothetical protein